MRLLLVVALGMCGWALWQTTETAQVIETSFPTMPADRLETQPAAPAKNERSSASLVSHETQNSIDRGTRWLMSALNRRGVGPDIDQPFDLSCTAITGLALLSQGNTPRGGRHSAELRQILEIMLTRIDDFPPSKDRAVELSLVQRKIGRHADLFFAALFLSQTLGESSSYDREIREKLERLIDVIASSQKDDGTWGEESWAPILGTVMGWESLRASSSCGIKVQASAELAGQALLKKLQIKSQQETNWMHDFYKTASTIRVLHSTKHRHEAAYIECVRQMIEIAKMDDRPFLHAGGEEYLALYLMTECLLQEQREDWQQWYPLVCNRLVKHQNRDGSWTGHHCITSRTFCTAAALLTLQAPRRSLPMSNL